MGCRSEGTRGLQSVNLNPPTEAAENGGRSWSPYPPPLEEFGEAGFLVFDDFDCRFVIQSRRGLTGIAT